MRQGKYRDRRFSDELVEACVRLVREWSPSPAPAWVIALQPPGENEQKNQTDRASSHYKGKHVKLVAIPNGVGRRRLLEPGCLHERDPAMPQFYLDGVSGCHPAPDVAVRELELVARPVCEFHPYELRAAAVFAGPAFSPSLDQDGLGEQATLCGR